MQELHVPQGAFTLERHPLPADPTLRAWDAADELLLEHLATVPVGQGDPPGAADAARALVILDDAFGALTTALASTGPTLVTDSHLTMLATAANLERNAVAPGTVTLTTSEGPFPEHIGVLVFKVPKTLALLEDQLRRIRPHLDPASVVVGGAMTRHVHTSTLDAVARVIGPIRTTRAHRKARLLHVTVAPEIEPGPWRWPSTFAVPGDGVTVVNHAGVFSATSLDIGTRLLLDHVPAGLGSARILDLGCGNGVVGVTAQVRNPDAQITFVDESYRAVASAEATYRASLGGQGTARFSVGDVLDLADGSALPPRSVDLVLLNPPFHADHVTGDATAWAMFRAARRVLRPGGELLVVGNRHLGYHTKLTRLFGGADLVASTAKFVLLRATRL